MNGRSVWKYVPPAGPILSLTLIGLVLLSALLYYRAVKIQRFLEPALAISQPRNEFAKNIRLRFQKEFGEKAVPGLKVRTSSILMDKSVLFTPDGSLKASAQINLQKVARIFVSLMKDDHARAGINLVLITSRFPSGGEWMMNAAERMKAQRIVGFIQDALFHEEPELARRYSTFFVTATQPTNPHEGTGDVIEFRIVPSEFLHIEVLEKLEKYAD